MKQTGGTEEELRSSWLVVPEAQQLLTRQVLTFPVQEVVPRKHYTTAHDVALEAAGAKRISGTAAVEDLPIVCHQDKENLVCHCSFWESLQLIYLSANMSQKRKLLFREN